MYSCNEEIVSKINSQNVTTLNFVWRKASDTIIIVSPIHMYTSDSDTLTLLKKKTLVFKKMYLRGSLF